MVAVVTKEQPSVHARQRGDVLYRQRGDVLYPGVTDSKSLFKHQPICTSFFANYVLYFADCPSFLWSWEHRAKITRNHYGGVVFPWSFPPFDRCWKLLWPTERRSAFWSTANHILAQTGEYEGLLPNTGNGMLARTLNQGYGSCLGLE